MGPAAITEGQAALDHGDWARARSSFAAALDQDETPEALYGLARAVEWAGDYRAAIDLYGRAYAAFRARGESRTPALIAARELSFLYAAVYGNAAAASGWIERARRLARATGDCVESGWVALAEALMTDDPDEKAGHVRTAIDIAQRLGDSDLAMCAIANEGVCLVLKGRFADGMRRVDESAAAACGGEVKDYVTIGEIYCHMLLCCELTLDVRRAQEWMSISESFARGSNSVWVSAICRMHYGGILTAAGRWADAEYELTASADAFDTGYRGMRGGAIVRLADLRVRQGRLAEAARLLTGLEFDSGAVRPLARMYLARGEIELAATTLRRHLAATSDTLLLAPELALLAEVELAAGRFDAAQEVSRRLRSVSADAGVPHVHALAEYTAGLCSVTDDEAALAHFEAALRAFATADLPLEVARTRLRIARLLAPSDPAVAVTEAQAALSSCERLGAGPEADAAAGILRSLGRPGRTPERTGATLTRRESEVLQHLVEGLSNEQIAVRLYISKRTVEHHVGSILGKLAVSSRAEAMAHAVRHGLLNRDLG